MYKAHKVQLTLRTEQNRTEVYVDIKHTAHWPRYINMYVILLHMLSYPRICSISFQLSYNQLECYNFARLPFPNTSFQ